MCVIEGDGLKTLSLFTNLEVLYLDTYIRLSEKQFLSSLTKVMHSLFSLPSLALILVPLLVSRSFFFFKMQKDGG